MARKSSKTSTPETTPAAAPKKRAAPSKRPAAPKASKAKPKDAPEVSEDEGPPPARIKGRSLVIVESPKKAKSINKFLGSKFVVKASMGHVRDLPKRKLGLDVIRGYAPCLRDHGRQEGHDHRAEARGRQGRHRLPRHRPRPRRRGHRLAPPGGPWACPTTGSAGSCFFEITEKAVKEAFNHVGPIDMDKVNAQQARRFLDRFVGYELSPLLWKKVARHLSAGRVQSGRRPPDRRAREGDPRLRLRRILADHRQGLPRRQGRGGRPLLGRTRDLEGGEVLRQGRGRRPGHPRRPGGLGIPGVRGRGGREARQARTPRSRPAPSSSRPRSGSGSPASGR